MQYKIFMVYVYIMNHRKHEIWADSCKKLKQKVLKRDLPWDDAKAPKAKPVNVRSTYMGAISIEEVLLHSGFLGAKAIIRDIRGAYYADSRH